MERLLLPDRLKGNFYGRYICRYWQNVSGSFTESENYRKPAKKTRRSRKRYF